ncbi:uncharacterized protein LOC119734427 [Patiria miniata]|uniref:Uncharacterized protein n=1 Tax=Patiria miniata TaxID=46514 RepID=A0A914AKB8_PATMI|nr:uncharacterized protein LOC119734427 [Patiria miniata]
MDTTSRTTLHRQCTQGLLTSLLLSAIVALCTSTPIPPEQIHPWRHYERLVRETHVLDEQHHNVYTSFKTIRFDDASIRIDDFRIAGVPSLNDLPAPVDRYSMQESELLPIHYSRLHVFEQILARARADEFQLRMEGDANFHDHLLVVLNHLQRVVSKLRQTMVSLDIAHDFDATPSNIVFANNQNHSYLNMRILYILQELNDNLSPALEDFLKFMDTHEQPSS